MIKIESSGKDTIYIKKDFLKSYLLNFLNTNYKKISFSNLEIIDDYISDVGIVILIYINKNNNSSDEDYSSLYNEISYSINVIFGIDLYKVNILIE